MKSALIAITLSPLLINLLVRTYAWLVLLGDTGVINRWLQAIGLIGAPLPLSGNMLSVDHRAGAHLPAADGTQPDRRARTDRRIAGGCRGQPGCVAGQDHAADRLPLSLPGIGSGSLLVFSFTISAFITPALLGGNRVSTISTLIYEKFTFSVNWPVGATLVMVLLVLTVGVVALHGWLFRED